MTITAAQPNFETVKWADLAHLAAVVAAGVRCSSVLFQCPVVTAV